MKGSSGRPGCVFDEIHLALRWAQNRVHSLQRESALYFRFFEDICGRGQCQFAAQV